MALGRRRKPAFADPTDLDGTVVVAEVVDGWLQAAETRTQPAPTIYDLVALVDRLKAEEPIRARAVESDLKWLMKKAERLGITWDSPWER